MARACGSSAHLLMKRESAYGQAATGNYLRLPFNRCNLGSEQGLIDDPVLGHDRPRAAIGAVRDRAAVRSLGDGEAADDGRHGRGQTAARRAVEAIDRQARERTEAGLNLDELPDLSAQGEWNGFYQAQLNVAPTRTSVPTAGMP